VAASSSSIYGDADSFPTSESVTPLPVSPYGVTKLAAEHMVTLYGTNFGLSTVSLRYFTVYGPRQRPDMAIQRMIRSSLGGPAFPLFGDGSASRSFTFIGDVVRANLAALEADVAPGTVLNLSGDEIVSVTELLELVGTLTGVDVPVDHFPSQPGDARHTGGATERAAELLGWTSSTPLADGIGDQIRWNRATTG
jgi:nucleoside-diphosphate-sugar epimerase